MVEVLKNLCAELHGRAIQLKILGWGMNMYGNGASPLKYRDKLCKACVLYKSGRLLEAVNLFDEVLEIIQNLKISSGKEHVTQAVTANVNEIIAHCTQALKLFPEALTIWLAKGKAFGILGHASEALSCYKEACRVDSNSDKAWNGVGSSLYLLGHYDEAWAHFEKANEINPYEAKYFYNKATLLTRLNQFKQANDCYDKAIEMGEEAIAWLKKGLLMFDCGQYEYALVCVSRAIDLDPTSSKAWECKAKVFLQEGCLSDALFCCGKAIEINPARSVFWFDKGLIYSESNHPFEAFFCFDKAIEIDSTVDSYWVLRRETIESIGFVPALNAN